MADSINSLRQRIRRTLNLDPIRGILGDSNGVLYEPNRPGYVRVRLRQGTGFTTYATVRNKATIQMIPGNPVLLYRDADNELAVYEADLQAQLQSGINPIANNPLDRAAFAAKNQTEILTALCYPLSPSSLKVGVKQWPYIIGSTIYLFNGGTIDLTSFVPASGNHVLVTIFVKTDQTLEAKAATARNILDPLDITDIQQCLTAKTAGSVALWCWRLYGGQTAITIQDSWLDLRQFINTDQQGSGLNLTAPFEITVQNFGANSIGLTWAGETAATFFAAPASVNGKPTFRAIQNSDLPGGGSGITQLTGDVTAGPGSGSQVATLTTVTLAKGGTGADLHLAGPGLFVQTANGGVVSVLSPTNFCDLRLTATSGTPVTTADVTGAATIYATPTGRGSLLSLYDGSNGWIPFVTTELSVAVPATQFRHFDVFAYNNAGTPTLETLNWNQTTGAITGATNATPVVITSAGHGLATNDLVGISGMTGLTSANGLFWIVGAVAANTFELNGCTGNGAYVSGGTWYKVSGATRATALAMQNGVNTKSGAPTRRYLGTGLTGGTSGQLNDSLQFRQLWSAYNRVDRKILVGLVGDHTYATAAWRIVNNKGQNLCVFVVGLAEDPVEVDINNAVTGNATGNTYVGGSIDTANSGTLHAFYIWPALANTFNLGSIKENVVISAVGAHYAVAVEYVSAGTSTYYDGGRLQGLIRG